MGWGMKPCMSPDDAARWEELNRSMDARNRAWTPCEDCVVRFAIEMRAQGRCDSWPVVLVGVSGRRPAHSREESVEAMRARWRESRKRSRERARMVGSRGSAAGASDRLTLRPAAAAPQRVSPP